MSQQEDSKQENQQSQRYEVVVLVANKYSEEEAADIIRGVAKLLQDNGGTIIAEENWGKRKLAYPIRHFFHAYYYLIDCDLPKMTVQDIDNVLRLDERLLRHIIVQKRIKGDEEIARERAAAARIAKQEAKLQAETAAEQSRAKTETADKPKEAVDVKALDEKLDKILDDTDDLL